MSHYEVDCPKLKKKEKICAKVNHLSKRSDFEEEFMPYLSRAKINRRDIVTLRDSGSCLDLVSDEHVKLEQLTGNHIFVKQSLDSKVHCLPVAKLECIILCIFNNVLYDYLEIIAFHSP